MRAVVMTMLGLALIGCSPAGGAKQRAPASDIVLNAELPAEPGAPVAAPAEAAMMAYAYKEVMWAPADRVKPLMEADQKLCIAAGPATCQVVAVHQSNSEVVGVQATLELRAVPAWIAMLRGRLEGDLKSAGGHMIASQVTSEDLTRSIVDGEARLRAQITLRDRLQKLLAERPGKLGDLLDVERELARVQGEIDSAQSTLAVMRTRVATSTLSLTYRSFRPPSEAQGAWAPLVEAGREVTETLADSLGTLVRVVVWLAPWALLVGLPLWLLRRRLPRLGRKPRSEKAPKE
jgi:hypothetical protein